MEELYKYQSLSLWESRKSFINHLSLFVYTLLNKSMIIEILNYTIRNLLTWVKWVECSRLAAQCIYTDAPTDTSLTITPVQQIIFVSSLCTSVLGEIKQSFTSLDCRGVLPSFIPEGERKEETRGNHHSNIQPLFFFLFYEAKWLLTRHRFS